MSSDPYPESTKLRAVSQDWDTILGFLYRVPYSLAHQKGYYLEYADESYASMLFKHFEIDPVALEQERQAMIQRLGDLNE